MSFKTHRDFSTWLDATWERKRRERENLELNSMKCSEAQEKIAADDYWAAFNAKIKAANEHIRKANERLRGNNDTDRR